MSKLIQMKSDSGENLFPITAVESGSNSNGKYVKYSDGTMIEWDERYYDNIAFSNDYGGRGILYLASKTITFPVAFVGDSPTCVCGSFLWGTGASWGLCRSTSLASALLYGFDLFPRASGTDTLISWIAIGRWK